MRELLTFEMDRRCDPWDVAHYPGGVAGAGHVFGQVDVARPEAVDGAVLQADLSLPG